MNFQPLMMKAVIFSKKGYQNSNTFFEEEQHAVNKNENITPDKNEQMHVDTTSQKLQAKNIFVNVYAKSVILEGELSSAEIQTAAGNK